MSRRYWDLRSPEDDTYSFALWMVRAGFPVITVDHLGTGESTLPDGAPAPLLGQVIAANDAAFRTLLDELRQNGLDGGGPLPDLRAVGVGHSMGAVLTVRQQATYGTYDGVALLGFDPEGLPAYLPPEVLLGWAQGPPDDHCLAELTLRMFGTAYPERQVDTTGAGFHGERIAEPVQHAIDAAATATLGAGGLLSMLPGNVAADAARLRVPVLVINGERDSLLNGRQARAELYQQAASFTTFVLPGMGHNHNLAANREELWEKLLRWVESVIPV